MGFLSRIGAALTRSAPVEAAGTGPRWARGKRLAAPAREVTMRRQVAAERAQWLAMNDPTAAAIVDRWAADLVSDGPSIVPRAHDTALRKSVADAWSRWWDMADAERRDDLGGILYRAARGIVASGEAFLKIGRAHV